MSEELKALEVAVEVDARGTACPGPLLDAKRAIGECPAGGVMCIMSSDEGTIIDIQRWSKKMKHEYVGDYEDDGYWRVFMRKTA